MFEGFRERRREDKWISVFEEASEVIHQLRRLKEGLIFAPALVAFTIMR